MTTLLRTRRVNNTLFDFFIGFDNSDWEKLEEVLSDKFVFDNTGEIGGDPLIITPQQFRDLFEVELFRYILHSQTSTFRIHLRDKDATAFCYLTSYHQLKALTKDGSASPVRIQAGTVQFHLAEEGEDWKIDYVCLKYRFREDFLPTGEPIDPYVPYEKTLKYRTMEELLEQLKTGQKAV